MKMMGEEDYPHSILQNGLKQITDEEKWHKVMKAVGMEVRTFKNLKTHLLREGDSLYL